MSYRHQAVRRPSCNRGITPGRTEPKPGGKRAKRRGRGKVTPRFMRRVGMNVDYQAVDWGTIMQRRTSKNSAKQGGRNMF